MRNTRWLPHIPRGQGRTFILVMLPFLLIPGIAIWHWAVNASAMAKVDEHLAWLESIGIPTEMANVFPQRENSDDEVMSHPAMVAEHARSSSDRLNRINGDDHGHRVEGLARSGFSWPRPWEAEAADVRNFFSPVRHETEAEAARDLLGIFAPERQRLEEVAEALKRPRAGWRVEREMYEEVEYPIFPELMSFMTVIRAFQDHTLLALALEDEAHAARFAASVYRGSLHTLRPPATMMHYLISQVYFELWMSLVHEGIRRGAWSDATLAEFDSMIANMPEEQWFFESLKTELTFHASALRQLKHGGNLAGHHPFENWQWEVDEVRERTGRVFSMVFTPRGVRLMALLDDAREFHDRALMQNGTARSRFERTDLDEIRQRREELDDADAISFRDVSMVWMLASILERHFQHRCSAALLQTGIALEGHRLQHGVLPESLEALLPEFLAAVPVDPYDGQPLRYRRQDDGSPLVWSVGLNGLDEGGKVDRNKDEGDRVWVTSPLKTP